MGKGQIGIIILILVVAGAAAYFLLPSLNILPSSKPITYKNDIITVNDQSISSTKIYSGGPTKVEFYVTNNGDQTAKNVIVYFSDLHGMSLTKLMCEDENICDSETTCETSNKKCSFDDLESRDVMKVSADLEAPTISVPTTEVVTYEVTYKYSGYREMSIPIIDGRTITKSPAEYKVSPPTYGPIVVEFEPPVGGTHVENGVTVTESWGVKGSPFQVTMNFQNIGSSSVGKIKKPIEVYLNDKVYSSGVYDTSDTSGTSGFQLSGLIEDGPCIKPNPLKIGGIAEENTIICNLENEEDFTQAWIMGTIMINYSYEYGFYKTLSFDVQPIR